MAVAARVQINGPPISSRFTCRRRSWRGSRVPAVLTEKAVGICVHGRQPAASPSSFHLCLKPGQTETKLLTRTHSSIEHLFLSRTNLDQFCKIVGHNCMLSLGIVQCYPTAGGSSPYADTAGTPPRSTTASPASGPAPASQRNGRRRHGRNHPCCR